jgi:DNA helicase II / ATP-dependent DNA helicase PcrA
MAFIAEYVVKQVKQKIDLKEVDKNHTIACIYRTNAQSRAIEEACVLHNVPYILFGGATSFYKRQEVKDCLCFLRWLYNGSDRSSMLRSFGTPKRGIGDSAIREFDQYCALVNTHWAENSPGILKPTPLEILYHISGDDSWCTLKNVYFPPLNIAFTGRSLKPLISFSLQMQKIRDVARHHTLETLLSAVIDEMDLIPHFDKISKSKSEFEERKENVFELQRASQKYNSDEICFPLASSEAGDKVFSESSLGNFLDDVTLVTDMVESTEASAEERLVVNLMTIHASKGLEFDTVYLLGMEDGTLPTSQVRKNFPIFSVLVSNLSPP